MYSLHFDVAHLYDPGEPGITVPISLKSGEKEITVTTKLDTGSTFCVFKREAGEDLGLKIENGILEYLSTPTGSFKAYGHPVTLVAFGFELEITAYFAATDDFKRNVLGRYGWLQQLRIGLVDYDGQLYLGLYDQPLS